MEPIILSAASSVLGSLLSISKSSGIRADFEKSEAGVRARSKRLVWWAIAASIFAVGSVATLLGGLVFHWSSGEVVGSIGATLILAAVVALFGSIVYRSAFATFIPQAALDAENQRAEEQEKLARDITLPALLRYNRERMDLYHDIATNQARIAGRNSQTAMAIGFLTLVAGSIVAIVSPAVTTKLITGGLAALGGIFSGYIARTFLMAQDKAIGQLYNYWEQPLTTSYVLMAERVAEAFADNEVKEKELGKLIDQLLKIATQRQLPSAESKNGSSRSRSNKAKSDRKKPGEGSRQSSQP